MVILFAGAHFAQCQESADFRDFMAAAGNNSVLFCGKLATDYSGLKYNGTYFWSSPQFRGGDVCYNGKVYQNVLMNIDAVRQELLVKQAEGAPAIVADIDFVPYFRIGSETYVNLRAIGQEDAPEGYFLQLGSGDGTVYYRVDKRFCNDTEYANGKLIGYDDPDYNDKISHYFRCDDWYCQIHKGKIKKLGRRKALKIAYGN